MNMLLEGHMIRLGLKLECNRDWSSNYEIDYFVVYR